MDFKIKHLIFIYILCISDIICFTTFPNIKKLNYPIADPSFPVLPELKDIAYNTNDRFFTLIESYPQTKINIGSEDKIFPAKTHTSVSFDKERWFHSEILPHDLESICYARSLYDSKGLFVGAGGKYVALSQDGLIWKFLDFSPRLLSHHVLKHVACGPGGVIVTSAKRVDYKGGRYQTFFSSHDGYFWKQFTFPWYPIQRTGLGFDQEIYPYYDQIFETYNIVDQYLPAGYTGDGDCANITFSDNGDDNGDDDNLFNNYIPIESSFGVSVSEILEDDTSDTSVEDDNDDPSSRSVSSLFIQDDRYQYGGKEFFNDDEEEDTSVNREDLYYKENLDIGFDKDEDCKPHSAERNPRFRVHTTKNPLFWNLRAGDKQLAWNYRENLFVAPVVFNPSDQDLDETASIASFSFLDVSYDFGEDAQYGLDNARNRINTAVVNGYVGVAIDRRTDPVRQELLSTRNVSKWEYRTHPRPRFREKVMKALTVDDTTLLLNYCDKNHEVEDFRATSFYWSRDPYEYWQFLGVPNTDCIRTMEYLDANIFFLGDNAQLWESEQIVDLYYTNAFTASTDLDTWFDPWDDSADETEENDDENGNGIFSKQWILFVVAGAVIVILCIFFCFGFCGTKCLPLFFDIITQQHGGIEEDKQEAKLSKGKT